MAFSGLQKTRLGLIGIARSLYGAFTGKSEAAVGVSFGVFSLIDDSGAGLNSLIDATGTGATSLITSSLSLVSLVDNSGQGLSLLINADGKGVKSDI